MNIILTKYRYVSPKITGILNWHKYSYLFCIFTFDDLEKRLLVLNGILRVCLINVPKNRSITK